MTLERNSLLLRFLGDSRIRVPRQIPIHLDKARPSGLERSDGFPGLLGVPDDERIGMSCRRAVDNSTADHYLRTEQSAGCNLGVPATSHLDIFRISPHVPNANDAVGDQQRKEVTSLLSVPAPTALLNICTCISQRPGIRNFPRPSITEAARGTSTGPALADGDNATAIDDDGHVAARGSGRGINHCDVSNRERRWCDGYWASRKAGTNRTPRVRMAFSRLDEISGSLEEAEDSVLRTIGL